jgi:hypothetical protein
MLPYSPTRLEWLELQLQANYREEDFSSPEKYHALNYFAKAPDTIVVFVQYSNQTSARTVDKAVEHGKRVVAKEIDTYRWSDWAKIEVRREPVEDR